MPEMGFTTLIAIYLPVGMTNAHQCITSHNYASNYGRKNVGLKTKYIFISIDFDFKAFYRKMRKCGLGSLYL